MRALDDLVGVASRGFVVAFSGVASPGRIDFTGCLSTERKWTSPGHQHTSRGYQCSVQEITARNRLVQTKSLIEMRTATHSGFSRGRWEFLEPPIAWFHFSSVDTVCFRCFPCRCTLFKARRLVKTKEKQRHITHWEQRGCHEKIHRRQYDPEGLDIRAGPRSRQESRIRRYRALARRRSLVPDEHHGRAGGRAAPQSGKRWLSSLKRFDRPPLAYSSLGARPQCPCPGDSHCRAPARDSSASRLRRHTCGGWARDRRSSLQRGVPALPGRDEATCASGG